MTIRERTEELEERMLAPYAALSKKSLGRDAAEEPCDIRTCYRRDCDRIIHCKAFRRLKRKTQVFLSPEGTGLCVEDVKRLYEKWYDLQKLISVENLADGEMIAASTMSGKDSMKILVYGNDQRLTVTALFDNLGKGASGAAVQCLNLMMGADETKGLIL